MAILRGMGAAFAVAASVALTPAAASDAQPAALTVKSASLRQDGQQLIWKVTLARGFTAAGLRREHRSLCLLLEPRRQRPRRLCVEPGRRGIALRYAVGAGGLRRRAIAAHVSRSGPWQMTASFLPAALGIGYRSLRWQVASSADLGASTRPSRPAFLRLHVPRLVGCAPASPWLVYRGPARSREVAIGLDDGPWDDPPSIDFVRLLARHHVTATFFEIGEQIGTYDPNGSVERAMLAAGDMIGDHTWNHPDMTGLSPAEQRDELVRTIHAIRAKTGFTPCLWRPPYGAVSPELVALARSLGLVTVMWDVDPRDWATPGTAAIVDNVLANAHSGSIVEEHFGGGPRSETLAALPAEIRGLEHRGYRIVTLTQLLGLRLIYK